MRPQLFLSTLLPLILMACNQPTQSPPHTASTSNAIVTASATTSATTNASFKGTDIRKDDIGGDFTLTDGSGKPLALSSLQGKAVILAFGFTNCPDVCPTELLTYSDALKQLGDQAKDVAVVFVSVDPERDTPDLIGRYAAQFNPAFIGLTDTTGGNEIARVKQQYKIVSAKTEIKSDTQYNVDHSSGAYLLDKSGKTIVFEPYGADAEQIAHDLRILLATNE